MFTGIIEAVGRVERAEPRGGGTRLVIAAPFADELRVDESVAVNGVCLTVVARSEASFEADVVEETLTKTNLGRLETGHGVNLERAMRAGGRLDGHLVQGHVDATGEVVGIEPLEGSHLVRVRYPERFAPYLIPVGSVALDGISLTVARLEGDELSVAIIPHTWEVTTVGTWEAGHAVNLEFDLIGKYVVRALELGVGAGGHHRDEPGWRALTG
jgi:riboflavin synthase